MISMLKPLNCLLCRKELRWGSTEVHFIDVGCGNMTLVIFPEGSILMYDCNITDENMDGVLSYLTKVIGQRGLDVSANSHRDADHMRGIAVLHDAHPIKQLWDSGVPGTTTDSPEYNAYMQLRRSLPTSEVEARKYWTFGDAKLRCMNSKWSDYSDANEQSLVFKIEYKGSSVMLGGDTNWRPWKEKIVPVYNEADLRSSILLAPHHGSLEFFDDPSDSDHYYTQHIQRMRPEMTLVSVGPNVNSLPDPKAIEIYEKYSTGSSQGNKVFKTEDKGTMKLVLKVDGGWSLSVNQ